MSTFCVNECGRYKNPFVANAYFCGKSCRDAYVAQGHFPTRKYTGTMCDNCYYRKRWWDQKNNKYSNYCGDYCRFVKSKPSFEHKGTGPPIVNVVYGQPNVQPFAIPIVQPAANQSTKQIGYDFDGVIHKSVQFDDKGQGRPIDRNSGDNECFAEIIELIKVSHKLGYKQYVVTNRKADTSPYVRMQLEKCFGKALGLTIFPDTSIHFVKGDKSPTIRALMLDEFYDDSPIKIAEISQQVPTFKQGFTLYQTFPLNANNKIRKIISNGSTIPVNENIKVMTYNVCWEALEGHHSKNIDMTHCKTGGRNLCQENIGNIISTFGAGSDFIALQEIKDVPTQWQSLKNHITILGNMMIHATRIGQSLGGIITLYNKHKFNHVAQYEGEFEPGRPYAVILFQNILDNSYIVFINLHFPHSDNNLLRNHIAAGINSLKGANNWSNYKVIMCGDFNKQEPNEYNTFLGTVGMKNIITRNMSNEPSTCCVSNSGTHNLKFDHIFSNFVAPTQYNTIDPNLHGIFKSDHLPVIAEFNTIQINIDNKKLRINKIDGSTIIYSEPFDSRIKTAYMKNQPIEFIYNNERHRVIFDSVNTQGKNVLYLV